MDEATKRQRARNKALAGKRGEMPYFEPLGLGRKGKPSATFPARQCDYKIGGEEITFRKERKNPRPGQSKDYLVTMVVGGTRCTANEITNHRCLKHLGAKYGDDD